VIAGCWDLSARDEYGLIRVECVLRSPQGDVQFLDVPLVDPTQRREALAAARMIAKATKNDVPFGRVLRELQRVGGAA
jgi:hypothetical protein